MLQILTVKLSATSFHLSPVGCLMCECFLVTLYLHQIGLLHLYTPFIHTHFDTHRYTTVRIKICIKVCMCKGVYV